MRDPYAAERGIWHKMKVRVSDPNAQNYRYYGGRGITMCERWAQSFDVFLADIGPRPSKAHTIERKDNDGPYSPDNCCWATRLEQASNRRNNKFLTFRGRRLTVAEWTRLRGDMAISTLYRRLGLGWSVEEALTARVDDVRFKRQLSFNGKTQTVSAWARDLGIPVGTLFKRIRMKWPIERILSTPSDNRYRRQRKR